MATHLCSWTPHTYSLSVIQLVKGQAVLLAHLPMKTTDAQIDKVVEILLRAFKGSISLKAMTGGNPNLEAPFFRSMICACALEGTLYVVTDNSKAIYSIGSWFGPGKKMFSTEAQREKGWSNFFASLPTEVQDWWTKVFYATHEPKFNRLIGHNSLDGWSANLIATDPEYQRRGYATALVKAVCEKASDEKKPVSLSTQSESNSEWYQRLGFELLGKVEISSSAGTWPDYFLMCTHQ